VWCFVKQKLIDNDGKLMLFLSVLFTNLLQATLLLEDVLKRQKRPSDGDDDDDDVCF
jgi:hypothetical protein